MCGSNINFLRYELVTSRMITHKPTNPFLDYDIPTKWVVCCDEPFAGGTLFTACPPGKRFFDELTFFGAILMPLSFSFPFLFLSFPLCSAKFLPQ